MVRRADHREGVGGVGGGGEGFTCASLGNVATLFLWWIYTLTPRLSPGTIKCNENNPKEIKLNLVKYVVWWWWWWWYAEWCSFLAIVLCWRGGTVDGVVLFPHKLALQVLQVMYVTVPVQRWLPPWKQTRTLRHMYAWFVWWKTQTVSRMHSRKAKTQTRRASWPSTTNYAAKNRHRMHVRIYGRAYRWYGLAKHWWADSARKREF